MAYIRTPQNVNVLPAQRARAANVLLRKVMAARELLESYGYNVEPPTEVHADLAAATINR